MEKTDSPKSPDVLIEEILEALEGLPGSDGDSRPNRIYPNEGESVWLHSRLIAHGFIEDWNTNSLQDGEFRPRRRTVLGDKLLLWLKAGKADEATDWTTTLNDVLHEWVSKVSSWEPKAT